jgi:hypothetical protein
MAKPSMRLAAKAEIGVDDRVDGFDGHGTAFEQRGPLG